MRAAMDDPSPRAPSSFVHVSNPSAFSRCPRRRLVFFPSSSCSSLPLVVLLLLLLAAFRDPTFVRSSDSDNDDAAAADDDDVFAPPDFLIVGTSKSASSSLYRYVTSHPCVLPASSKQLNYFNQHYASFSFSAEDDDDEKKKSAAGDEWYRRQFPPLQSRDDASRANAWRQKVVDAHSSSSGSSALASSPLLSPPPFVCGLSRRLTCESSVGYLWSVPSASRIRSSLGPFVKIVATVRDHYDRARSSYNYNYGRKARMVQEDVRYRNGDEKQEQRRRRRGEDDEDDEDEEDADSTSSIPVPELYSFESFLYCEVVHLLSNLSFPLLLSSLPPPPPNSPCAVSSFSSTPSSSFLSSSFLDSYVFHSPSFVSLSISSSPPSPSSALLSTLLSRSLVAPQLRRYAEQGYVPYVLCSDDLSDVASAAKALSKLGRFLGVSEEEEETASSSESSSSFFSSSDEKHDRDDRDDMDEEKRWRDVITPLGRVNVGGMPLLRRDADGRTMAFIDFERREEWEEEDDVDDTGGEEARRIMRPFVDLDRRELKDMMEQGLLTGRLCDWDMGDNNAQHKNVINEN